MKTSEEVYDMINSRSGKVWNKKEISIMVAKVYATEAIRADRERIKQHHADELPTVSFNDLAIELGKDIDNLPIELK